ncbi:hypothetical protein HYU06_05465 [Candidatus Woesearchaeota archaeon]|nr:hypothetical protein [Candidatus Woesearchaeota archaeon]
MYYEINLWNSIGQKATEFALTPNELNGYAKLCEKDIHITKPYAACAGLFGSVLTKGMEANDIDVFCVVERDNYLKLRQKIQEWQKHSSKHIHLFVQTKDDLVNNFKKKDAPLLDILKKGAFFWGQEVIVEAIKNVKNRE